MRTYATLLIYPVCTDPRTITDRLGIEPSSLQVKGGPMASSLRCPPRIAEIDGWFLTTEDRIESRDLRRHLDWLLNQLGSKTTEIQSLQAEGARTYVSYYWVSRFGEGGPMISPEQMTRLGALNIELWFDIYFLGDDEPD